MTSTSISTNFENELDFLCFPADHDNQIMHCVNDIMPNFSTTSTLNTNNITDQHLDAFIESILTDTTTSPADVSMTDSENLCPISSIDDESYSTDNILDQILNTKSSDVDVFNLNSSDSNLSSSCSPISISDNTLSPPVNMIQIDFGPDFTNGPNSNSNSMSTCTTLVSLNPQPVSMISNPSRILGTFTSEETCHLTIAALLQQAHRDYHQKLIPKQSLQDLLCHISKMFQNTMISKTTSRKYLVHLQNECRPCYHVLRACGCKNGIQACNFCHFCSQGRIRSVDKYRKHSRSKNMALKIESLNMAVKIDLDQITYSQMSDVNKAIIACNLNRY